MRRRGRSSEPGGAVLVVVSVVLAAVLLLALAYAVATHKSAAGDRVGLGLVASAIALIAITVLRYVSHRTEAEAEAEEVVSTTRPPVASPPDRPERSPSDPRWYEPLDRPEPPSKRDSPPYRPKPAPGEPPPAPPRVPALPPQPVAAGGIVLGGDPDADAVQVSVFAPAVAEVGATLLVQVFAHLVERATEALAQAQEFDADAKRRGRHTLHVPIMRGSVLVIELRMGALRVREPVQRMVWSGLTDSVGFAVEVPTQTAGATVVGTVSVRCEGIPVGDVTFKLQISTLEHVPGLVGDALAISEARRFEHAFLSYATEDRAKVLDSVKIVRALGMRFFQDVLNLDPGERWERRLYIELDRSDVLLLFWSRAAKESEWVRKEVGYALGRNGGSDDIPPVIRPIFIEGPPVETPWKELSTLHWDDPLLHMKP